MQKTSRGLFVCALALACETGQTDDPSPPTDTESTGPASTSCVTAEHSTIESEHGDGSDSIATAGSASSSSSAATSSGPDSDTSATTNTGSDDSTTDATTLGTQAEGGDDTQTSESTASDGTDPTDATHQDSHNSSNDDTNSDSGDADFRCRDPRDIPVGEDCIRERECSLVDPCDDGYECADLDSGQVACRCTDPAICGVVCSTADDCPDSPHECDPTIGACRKPRICLTDLMCVGSAVCIDGRCGPPGLNENGERCSHSAQCQSGVCREDVCLKKCRHGSDCSAGESCKHFYDIQACVAESFACDGTCTNGEVCDGRCQPGCYTSADCAASQVCGHHSDATGSFMCWDADVDCGPDEFSGFTNDSPCLLHRQCFADADCPSGYSCLDDDDVKLSWGRNQITRVCGRHRR